MPESQQPQDGINLVLQEILKTPDMNVLDVGAGEGKWGRLLKGKVKLIDGIEVWAPYIKKYNLIPQYDHLFNINMIDFNYESAEYDIMILGDVLEHLKYDDAVNFINKSKNYIKTIYLIIPISICHQDGGYFGNPFESHLYQWKDDELKKLFDFKLIHEGYNPNGLVKIGTYCWKK
jgi:predicted TPR repeat methyltransferase